MKRLTIILSMLIMATISCTQVEELGIVVINPGHFHASLLQKNDLDGVSSNVKVYAQPGSELQAYEATIESYNTRPENPTSWQLDVYAGEDYLEKLPMSDGRSFVVLAGNNRLKTDYILESVKKGYHVISDKPLAINTDGYKKLEEAYKLADQQGLVIYDMMTERYDVQNVITRMLMSDSEIFGEVSGKIEIEDIHHFFKEVSGKPLTRPMWYFDVRQQGEGIADVTTHFIDLIFWECFPEESISVTDVEVISADRFPTSISLDEYNAVTGADQFPDYLQQDIKDGVLNVYSNGTIEFKVKDIPVKILMRWDYAPQPGSGDRFHEIIPGTNSSLEIVQDASTGFSRKLFIKTTPEIASKAEPLLKQTYPNVSLVAVEEGRYVVEIPAEYRHPHEEHFNMVGRTFIECLKAGKTSDWEKGNTLTKYYITTSAVNMALGK